MTPRETERLRSRLADIKRIFSTEKLCYDRYPDKSGVRYLPSKYYLQLGDYTRGLTYLKWFSKNFPDDPGIPFFLFEWLIILFKNGKTRKTEKKAFEVFCANTYLFDSFFGKPVTIIDKWESSNLENAAFSKHLGYNCNQIELADFSDWLINYTSSHKFTKLSSKYIDLQMQLKKETDPAVRNDLFMQARQLQK